MRSNRALAIYLRDHLAGSAGGVSLARQLARGAGSEAERSEMEGIAADIEADRRSLLALMERLEIKPSRVKQAGAWLGERLGRVKLNASKPDRRVLQYEAMIMGVTGKLELWRSLGRVEGDGGPPALKAGELGSLEGRAEDQLRRLEKLHGGAASALRG